MKPDLDIKEIALRVCDRWPKLAKELGMTPEDIDMVAREPLAGDQSGPQADRERCEHMLALWVQRNAASGEPTGADVGTWLLLLS